MPFENCVAQVYSAASVMQNAPAAPGVFGLSNAQGWIYIGESDDIRGSLLHLLDFNTSVPGRRPANGFCYEVHPKSDCAQRRARLIQELRPRVREYPKDE